MKAILDERVLVRFLRACLPLALVLFSSLPAYCEELSAEQIIERCKSKLDKQEAVLLKIDDDQFIVIAARNHSLEDEIVTLKHVFGAAESERVYLYYKHGSNAAVLKLPFLEDDLSQQEVMTMRRYYAEKGRMTITLSSSRSQKIFHPVVSRKAHHR